MRNQELDQYSSGKDAFKVFHPFTDNIPWLVESIINELDLSLIISNLFFELNTYLKIDACSISIDTRGETELFAEKMHLDSLESQKDLSISPFSKLKNCIIFSSEPGKIGESQEKVISSLCLASKTSGTSLAINNSSLDPLFHQFRDLSHGIKSAYVCPLISNGNFLGSLHIYQKDSYRVWGQYERSFINTLSFYLSMVVAKLVGEKNLTPFKLVDTELPPVFEGLSFKADKDLSLSSLNYRALRSFGVNYDEKNYDIDLLSFIDDENKKASLISGLEDALKNGGHYFDFMTSIKNIQTSHMSRVLLRFTPFFEGFDVEKGERVYTWEVIGLDFTYSAQVEKVVENIHQKAKTLEYRYHVLRELSQTEDLESSVQKVFDLIDNKLSTHRIWLGLINEVGTKIVGQYWRGSEWKYKVQHLRININDLEFPLDSVISKRQVVMVRKTSDLFAKASLKRLGRFFGDIPVIFIPLVAARGVNGVLAVQVKDKDYNLNYEDLDMLESVVRELALVFYSKRLETKIVEEKKMKRTGLLASGIAHNFNNLMQGVIGETSLLKVGIQGSVSKQELESNVERIDSLVSKASSLVRKLTDYTGDRAESRKDFSINRLIDLESASFFGLLSSGQELEMSFRDSLPNVFANPDSILTVLRDLISIASERSHAKGTIRLSTELLDLHILGSKLELEDGIYCVIKITDCGLHMEEEELENCFEPFYFLNNMTTVSGGVGEFKGLSLPMAKVIARRNGGDIDIYNTNKSGVRYSLYLPVEKSDDKKA